LTIAMIAPASTQTQMATCVQIQSGDMRPSLDDRFRGQRGTDQRVDSSGGRASIAGVSPDPASPAERAAAVLRAAEAAAAAARSRPAAAPPAARSRPAVPGGADRLLLAADELSAGVDAAREQLEELHDALGRLAG
jgi:hypothetical protein